MAPNDTDNPFGAPAGNDEGDNFDIPAIDESSGGGPGSRFKAGKYPAKLIGLDKATSAAGNPMWVWLFVVLVGPGAGQQLKIYTALTSAAMWKLGEVLAALRLGQPGKASQFKKSDAIGKFCILDCEDSEYKGRKQTQANTVLPIDLAKIPELEKLAAAEASKGDIPPV